MRKKKTEIQKRDAFEKLLKSTVERVLDPDSQLSLEEKSILLKGVDSGAKLMVSTYKVTDPEKPGSFFNNQEK